MRRQFRTLALAMLTTILALAATAQAQTRRRIDQRGSFRPPGTSIWITPAPRWEYQFGGVRIYPGRNQKGWQYWPPPAYQWPYGYPNGYTWPYGNPGGYAWPYGNSFEFKRRVRRGRN